MIRREPPPPEARRTRQARGDRANILLTLLRPESLYILPFAFFWGFGAGFMGPMMGAFYADKGLTFDRLRHFWPDCRLFQFHTDGHCDTVAGPERIGLRRTALIGVCVMPFEVAMFCTFAADVPPPLAGADCVMVALMGFADCPLQLSGHYFALSLGIQGTGWYGLRAPVEPRGLSASRQGCSTVTGFLADAVGWVYFFPIASLFSLTAGPRVYVGMFNRVSKGWSRNASRQELDPDATHVSRVRLAHVLQFLALIVQILSRLLEFLGYSREAQPVMTVHRPGH